MASVYPMLVVVGLCLLGVRAYPEGAPAEACRALEPLHPDPANLGTYYPTYTQIIENATNPFRLTLSASSVKQGESLTVGVTSEGNATFYEGFFLVAVKKGDIATRIGRFADAPANANWKNGPCMSTENSVKSASMTHNSKVKKYEHSLEWIADTAMTGDFCIQGIMVHETEEWFKLDGTDDGHCFTIMATTTKDPNGAAQYVVSAFTLLLCAFVQLF